MADRIAILTGGIGCGKSLVAERLSAKGIAIVDADAISHQLTGPQGRAIKSIRAALGSHLITNQESLDRPKVRELVFKDPQIRARLESILHPMIQEEARLALRAAKSPYAIYMVPLWVERENHRPEHERSASGLSPIAVIVVDCDTETQIARVMRRSGLARPQVEAIMAAQASREQRRLAADIILDNSGPIEALEPQIEALHQRLIHS